MDRFTIHNLWGDEEGFQQMYARRKSQQEMDEEWLQNFLQKPLKEQLSDWITWWRTWHRDDGWEQYYDRVEVLRRLQVNAEDIVPAPLMTLRMQAIESHDWSFLYHEEKTIDWVLDQLNRTV